MGTRLLAVISLYPLTYPFVSAGEVSQPRQLFFSVSKETEN